MATQDEYAVELTKQAERTYTRIYDQAQACIGRGDVSNSRVTLLKMVDEVIDKIIPHDPFHPSRSLSGPLSNIFRISKARMRIFYAASSKAKTIAILFISDTPRKYGDTRDPYSVFTKLVVSGQFDEVFDRLGVRRPIRETSALQPFQLQ